MRPPWPILSAAASWLLAAALSAMAQDGATTPPEEGMPVVAADAVESAAPLETAAKVREERLVRYSPARGAWRKEDAGWLLGNGEMGGRQGAKQTRSVPVLKNVVRTELGE